MRQFLNVLLSPYESVNDFALRLEKAFAAIRDNYSLELTMVDKTQHLRERFYQALRREMHQKLTPSYEDGRTPYVVLIKQARELEAEFYPKKEITAKGATEVDPQVKEVIQTLECLEYHEKQKADPAPSQKTKKKRLYL